VNGRRELKPEVNGRRKLKPHLKNQTKESKRILK
jgi:hypothetical protein